MNEFKYFEDDQDIYRHRADCSSRIFNIFDNAGLLTLGSMQNYKHCGQ